MLGAQFFINKNTSLMTYTTLSERLKQAGIKESKPKCDRKLRKNKSSKKSRSLNFSYNGKYIKKGFQSTIKKNKKFPNPQNNYVLPYRETSPQEDFNKKLLSSKISSNEDLGENVESSQKEATFVYLDFIEDCQNYKKKIRTPKEDKDRKSQGMCPRNPFTNEKQDSGRKVEPKKSQEGCKISSHSGSVKKERNYFFKNKRKELQNLKAIVHSAETENKNLKNRTQKVFAETLPRVQPLLNKLSSDNVAKIDKKYLQSLLSITMGKKKIGNAEESEDEGEGSEATTDETEMKESRPKERKRITGKDFFEKKVKKTEVQDESSQNISKNQIFLEEKKNKWKDVSFQNNNTFTRIVRDLTKSEEQVQFNTEKNTYSFNNSNITDKNVTLSKPDLKDIRKKRKMKNKYRKTNNNEYIETSFPSEVSKVADIKELWRRNVQKKSDNSLSSLSSCTVPESEEFPGIKNLDSYKILKRLVEEEIKNIMSKSENKDDYNKQIELKENNLNVHSPKELGQMENIYKILRRPLVEKSNNINPNEVSLFKRKQMQADTNGEKQFKSHLRSILADDIPDEANPNWKLRNKKESDGVKIPSQIVESWSILDRLEQAFLALGTPTFPNKNVKPKLSSTNAKNSTEKKHEKEKNEKKISGSKNSKCREGTSTKVKPQNSQHNKVESIKASQEKLQRNKQKKDPLKNNLRKSNSKTPSRNVSQKTIDLSRNCKKGTNATLVKENKSKLEKVKNTSKVTLPNPNQKKVIEDNLERKSTFRVISEKDSSVMQPRKTKSCEKNENIHFPVTNNKEYKTQAYENLKEEPKLRSKSIDNDERSKRASGTLPKRLAKNPVKDKPLQTFEKPKSKSEKGSLKGTVETLMTGSRSHFNQEKKNEKTVPTVKTSKNGINNSTAALAANTDTNSSASNNRYKYPGYHERNYMRQRGIKKRSILSMRVNQQCNKNLDTLQQIEEKENLSSSPLPSDNKTCPPKTGQLVQTLHTKANTFHSNSSSLCTATCSNEILQNFLYNTQDITAFPRVQTSQKQMIYRTSNSNLKEKSNIGIGESNILRSTPSWEKDISHYNTIVKEIMSQYKRINGFLKQTEKSNQFADALNETNTKARASVINVNDPYITNIHTYRKKIISEYKAVPIFEYKTKLEEYAGGNCKMKRNLSVAKDLRTYMDVDVKDYHPKVKKILDSQLYVEPKNLVKQNESKVKPAEKKSSLQEMLTSKKGKIIHQDEKLRSFSTTKVFSEQQTPLILSNNHSPTSKKNNSEA